MKSNLLPNGVAAGIALLISTVVGSVAKGEDAPAGVTAMGPNPAEGLAIDGWIVYPSLFVGSVFNDNIYATAYGRRSAVGVRVRPSLQAGVDNGLHKTTAYISADAQLYPGLGSQYRLFPTPTTDVDPTNVTGRAGLRHIWSPVSDLSVYFTADYTRQNGLFGSNFGAGAPAVYVPAGYTVAASQQFSNQISGSVAVEKKIADWFVRGSTGVQYVAYDSRPSGNFPFLAASGDAQNGLSYTASLRGGVWLSPMIYGFVEPTLDLRRYENSISDTNGYRIIGGFGSDLISLFRGEVYGGYQSQSSEQNFLGGTVSKPTYGARLLYYPTPYLTFTATVDQTLAAAAAPTTLAAHLGQWSPASLNTQSKLQVDYAFSPFWTAYMRGGYGETRWANSPRGDTVWAAGVGVNYTFWRNMAITLDYQFQKTGSNANGLLNILGVSHSTGWGFVQNVVSAGVTYRY
ncbi:outer membrane beta-barrel protein [Methylosinus sp. H3A]|uniref:outer membrane beta-barrel protein n=1 Tax=Methylosinus sp. H3A TaxID=2785786 RepID=UPI0018C24466|nr:outer membrane beta-barrel protein [Methylosinus sp. H3A]MBG0811718.1 outer membrane beta-barrel protein [Methylosinus sp. H3A]